VIELKEKDKVNNYIKAAVSAPSLEIIIAFPDLSIDALYC